MRLSLSSGEAGLLSCKENPKGEAMKQIADQRHRVTKLEVTPANTVSRS